MLAGPLFNSGNPLFSRFAFLTMCWHRLWCNRFDRRGLLNDLAKLCEGFAPVVEEPCMALVLTAEQLQDNASLARAIKIMSQFLRMVEFRIFCYRHSVFSQSEIYRAVNNETVRLKRDLNTAKGVLSVEELAKMQSDINNDLATMLSDANKERSYAILQRDMDILPVHTSGDVKIWRVQIDKIYREVFSILKTHTTRLHRRMLDCYFQTLGL